MNEKKEKINYIIPVPNNNSLTISINTSTNKNNGLGIDKKKNYQKIISNLFLYIKKIICLIILKQKKNVNCVMK